MRALRRARLPLAVLISTSAVCLFLTLGSASAAQLSPSPSTALADVERQGSNLAAAGERFQVWGFNYGLRERYPILRYFDQPTKRGLDLVAADMREARLLGANTLRVYLELGAFMNAPYEPNARALAALAAVLDEAERLHVYLDLTGNLVWRGAPAWYDALPEEARWAVQARFWRAVASTAQNSPAVLVYELTSEPVIHEASHWYCGELDGYTFIQRIVKQTSGRDPSGLARRWARLLRGAIRAYDRDHLVGLGMLPSRGPFGAANVADLLDVLLVHHYPEEGRHGEAVSVIREFTAEGKPVVLGETAPLLSTRDTWRRFLIQSSALVDGYLFFYDGRTPRQVGGTAADVWYARALEQFLGLRDALLSVTPA